jgi:hypothetical protein
MKVIEVKYTNKLVTLELDKWDLDTLEVIKNHKMCGVVLNRNKQFAGGAICALINKLAQAL